MSVKKREREREADREIKCGVNAQEMSITGHLRTRTDIYIKRKWHIIEGRVMVVEEVTEYVNVEHIQEDIVDGIVDEGVYLLLYFVAHMQQIAVLRLNGGGKPKWWHPITQGATNLAYKKLGPRGIEKIMRYTMARRYARAKRAANADPYQLGNLSVEDISRYAGASVYTGSNRFSQLRRAKTAPPPEYPGQSYGMSPPVLGPTQSARAEKIVINSEPNMDGQRNRDARRMLTFKNSLTRKYQSRCVYHMMLVKKTKNLDTKNYHYTSYGEGPALYGTYYVNQRIVDESAQYMRDKDFGVANVFDSGLDPTYRGVGMLHTVYVFAADWPFLAMNHDLNTQNLDKRQYGLFLSWSYKFLAESTDPNFPRTAPDVIKNKDWSYFSHYYTTYTLDMVNVSHMPYVVEILLFKFKADPDTMNYQRQVEAVTNKQNNSVTDYINMDFRYPADIIVVKRKRIYLRGLDNNAIRNNGASNADHAWCMTPNTNRENSKRYKFIVKRKYVMKRPILNTYNTTMTEFEFFNTYYEKDKGIYCRIQAFPLEPDFVVPESVADNTVKVRAVEDALNMSEGNNCDKLHYGVELRMHKQSRWKLDENMYKGSVA